MSQNYPYYIPAMINAGQMTKLFHDKKYKTHSEAIEALSRWAKNHQSHFNRNQFVVLEYIGIYQCKILSIFTNGNYTYVDKECSPEHF